MEITYKNGRQAKNGDKVMLTPEYGVVVHDNYCSGKIAPISPNDPMPNLKDCLHMDDVLQMVANGLMPVPTSNPEFTGG